MTGDVEYIPNLTVHFSGSCAMLDAIDSLSLPTGELLMIQAVTALFAITAGGLIVARAAGWVSSSWLETVGVITGEIKGDRHVYYKAFFSNTQHH